MIQTISQGTIGSRLAIPALMLLPIAVIAHRSEWLGFPIVTAMLALSILLSIVILICSTVAYFRNKKPQFRRNMRKTFMIASVMPLLIIGLIFKASSSGKSLPVIHDITTDTINVPQFKAAVIERGDSSNSLAVVPDVIQQQIKAFPQIQTLQSTLKPDQAFQHAVEIAQQLGWTVYHLDPTNGLIEAVDKTLIWGFIDDIVIRIQPTIEGSKIDLRSVSRVGKGDLGANAHRIEKFLTAY